MNLLLTLLLLAPLLLPPVFSITPYERFKKQHIINAAVNCNRDLNPILQFLNKQCKRCNSFILLGGGTNLNHVKQVCTNSGGIFLGGNLYESRRSFPVVECNLLSGYWPPNCNYGQTNVQNNKIVLGCDQSGFPVHFQDSC